MNTQKIEIPKGHEIESIETIDGAIVVTYREKRNGLPKTWEEFTNLYPIPDEFAYSKYDLSPLDAFYGQSYNKRLTDKFAGVTSDRKNTEALIALCQLVLLRDCYNDGWTPDWKNEDENKYVIGFNGERISWENYCIWAYSPLYFKTESLCIEFIENFRDLIEKLKPLYGIKEGVER